MSAPTDEAQEAFWAITERWAVVSKATTEAAAAWNSAVANGLTPDVIAQRAAAFAERRAEDNRLQAEYAAFAAEHKGETFILQRPDVRRIIDLRKDRRLRKAGAIALKETPRR